MLFAGPTQSLPPWSGGGLAQVFEWVIVPFPQVTSQSGQVAFLQPFYLHLHEQT
ncbi:hypothetical protein DPMN_149644 [Dreissena polymorpha]|uniref:Uncharacterized protein n=1 Tax=Dreissena polymorpha TaxID=45954 RepID=A0A9D4FD26_DREPO|nr:hypothetical protein DPMN_149644 [Dreissena polymorpha]